MSAFGMFHTAVSLLPVGFGFVALVRYGAIDPRTRVGLWYVVTMLIGTISSWGFLLTKGFNEAQVLTLLTLAVVLGSVLTVQGRVRPAGLVQTLGLSFSYLLLWVFTTTETLTRVPVGQPYASGPDDPALLPVRLILGGVFLLVAARQMRLVRLPGPVILPA